MSARADHIRVILFDVGGVLVQLAGVAALQEWMHTPVEAEEIWRLWLHSPSVRAFETGRTDSETFGRELIAELGLKTDAQEFLSAFAAWPTGLYPDTLELLERIPRRFTRALLSNSNSLHWPRVMDEMALGSAVDHAFVSHLTGKIKPDAEAFEHVLSELQCKPAEVFFLDDNRLNTNVAAQLGFHVAHVRGTAEAKQALANAGIFEERT